MVSEETDGARHSSTKMLDYLLLLYILFLVCLKLVSLRFQNDSIELRKMFAVVEAKY